MVRKLPIPIDKEEFYKLLEAAKEEREQHRKPKGLTPRGKRINEYIIAMVLGYGAGMRISEIVGLDKKIQPLSKEQVGSNFIRVIGGKGGKDRVVPLPGKVFLKAGVRRDEFKRALPLKTHRRGIQRYVTELAKKVLKKHITFHTLRHTFGTLAAENKPLHEVQMLMGHSRLDTTGIYLHANPQKALEGMEEVF